MNFHRMLVSLIFQWLMLLISGSYAVAFTTNTAAATTTPNDACTMEFIRSPVPLYLQTSAVPQQQFLHCQAQCVDCPSSSSSSTSKCQEIQYQWTFNRDIIRNDTLLRQRWKLHHHQNGSLLEIQTLKGADVVGLYVCFASNGYGTIASEPVMVDWPKLHWKSGGNDTIYTNRTIKDGSYLYAKFPEYAAYPPNHVNFFWRCRENKQSDWRKVPGYMTTFEGALYRHMLKSRGDNDTQCRGIISHRITMETMWFIVNIAITDEINKASVYRCPNPHTTTLSFPLNTYAIEGDDFYAETLDQVNQCSDGFANRKWKFNGKIVSEKRQLILQNLTTQDSGHYIHFKSLMAYNSSRGFELNVHPRPYISKSAPTFLYTTTNSQSSYTLSGNYFLPNKLHHQCFWLKDGILATQYNANWNMDSRDCSLSMAYLSPKDSGIYQLRYLYGVNNDRILNHNMRIVVNHPVKECGGRLLGKEGTIRFIARDLPNEQSSLVCRWWITLTSPNPTYVKYLLTNAYQNTRLNGGIRITCKRQRQTVIVTGLAQLSNGVEKKLNTFTSFIEISITVNNLNDWKYYGWKFVYQFSEDPDRALIPTTHPSTRAPTTIKLTTTSTPTMTTTSTTTTTTTTTAAMTTAETATTASTTQTTTHNSTALPSTTNIIAVNETKNDKGYGIIGVVIAGCLLLGFLLLIVFCMIRKKQRQQKEQNKKGLEKTQTNNEVTESKRQSSIYAEITPPNSNENVYEMHSIGAVVNVGYQKETNDHIYRVIERDGSDKSDAYQEPVDSIANTGPCKKNTKSLKKTPSKKMSDSSMKNKIARSVSNVSKNRRSSNLYFALEEEEAENLKNVSHNSHIYKEITAAQTNGSNAYQSLVGLSPQQLQTLSQKYNEAMLYQNRINTTSPSLSPQEYAALEPNSPDDYADLQDLDENVNNANRIDEEEGGYMPLNNFNQPKQANGAYEYACNLNVLPVYCQDERPGSRFETEDYTEI